MKIKTASQVKKIQDPGYHAVAGAPTLFLAVSDGNGKSWVQRLTIRGRRHNLGLGSVEWVSLADARHTAYENRRLARTGGDPLAERRKEQVPTFREAAEQTFEGNKARWKNQAVVRNWRLRLEKHVYPKIGSLRVDAVTQQDVLNILKPIWTKMPETGRKVRQIVRSTLQWAQAHGFVETNVAADAIDGALPKMPRTKENFRALPWQDVPDAIETIRQCDSGAAARLALEFLILTATRGNEVRNAVWDEIDMEKRLWRIPAARMKSKRDFEVPLTDATIEILEQAQQATDGSGLIFPSPHRRGKPLSDAAMNNTLRIAGLSDRTVAHGFRASFKSWAADTGRPRDATEACLAHVVGGTEGAYLRTTMLERRTTIMDAWATYLTGKPADDDADNVVRLRNAS